MIIDITGMRFGKLVITGERKTPDGKNTRWKCICDCGEVRWNNSTQLRRGQITSCGCSMGDSKRTHGLSKTREYKCWLAAKGRCHSPSYDAYAAYGARGIVVCEEWRESFENFYADMGACPSGHTLERRDNNGPYSPDNCYWATRKEQANNTRRTRLLTHNGVTLSVSEWARKIGITSQAITQRLKRKPGDMDYALSNK